MAYQVSIPDRGPLSFRWNKIVIERDKPPIVIHKEADATYLMNQGLTVREIVDKTRKTSAPAAPSPSLEDSAGEELSASDALDAAVSGAPRKKFPRSPTFGGGRE